MRLWLDEMIPAEVARQLCRLGYDVRGAQEPENKWAWGLGDEEQLAAAARERRALISYDLRDFVVLSLQWAPDRREHAGIVLIHPRTIPPGNVGEIVRSLARFLDTHRDDAILAETVVFLEASSDT